MSLPHISKIHRKKNDKTLNGASVSTEMNAVFIIALKTLCYIISQCFLTHIVKSCAEFEILPQLQKTSEAFHSGTDAGRKHETPGSETKNLITQAQQAAWDSCTKSKGDVEKPSWMWCRERDPSQLRNSAFREPWTFKKGHTSNLTQTLCHS